MTEPGYRITPSLLNKYQDYIDSERLWDTFYGASDEPKVTLAEFEEKQEKELLDAVNRAPHEPIEAASKGTALNEIVDCLLEGRKPEGDIALVTVRDPQGRPQHINAQTDGFSFNFDINLCMDLAAYFRGSTCQYLCEATMDTSFGPVILYGYLDYLRKDVVYDLKSTSRYDFGKFSTGWQKMLYPWVLIESGEVQTISGFEYTVVKLSGGTPASPIITGELFKEWYDYDHAFAEQKLRGITESLLSWVENHRSEITNQRIFNK